VPLKNCAAIDNNYIWDLGTVRKYCPNFDDSHFLYGDYESKKASWYRLGVHMCDPKARALIGKSCKSEEEI